MITTYFLKGNRVEIKKQYRTKTQYEWVLTIFIGDSDHESISIYQKMWLTKKSALNEAKRAIFSKNQPRIEKVI